MHHAVTDHRHGELPRVQAAEDVARVSLLSGQSGPAVTGEMPPRETGPQPSRRIECTPHTFPPCIRCGVRDATNTADRHARMPVPVGAARRASRPLRRGFAFHGTTTQIRGRFAGDRPDSRTGGVPLRRRGRPEAAAGSGEFEGSGRRYARNAVGHAAPSAHPPRGQREAAQYGRARLHRAARRRPPACQSADRAGVGRLGTHTSPTPCAS